MYVDPLKSRPPIYGTPFYKASQVNIFPGGEAFLLESEDASFLYDSGFGFSGKQMTDTIKNRMKGRPLDYILLTHSHYDHALGSVVCADEWKNLKIVSSEYAAEVFSRPSARAVMYELDKNAASLYSINESADITDKLHADITVKDNDIINLNGFKIRAIALPGHTKCSMGYFFEDYGFLLSCETIGLFIGGSIVMPSYLSGYETTIQSINRLMNMDISQMLLPHYGVVYGSGCRKLLSLALHWAVECKELIVKKYLAGKNTNEIMKELKNIFYTKNVRQIYPEKAFTLNTGYMIAMIIRECCGNRREHT